MPKVAQQDLDEFGRAVKRARGLKGWTLDQLGGSITPSPGKSFLSSIEKGKRDISPPTVGKLIKALALPETWIDRFLDADITPEAEETEQDQQAERLMRIYARDTTAPESTEGLLIGLAETFSTERFIDHFTAYASLKSALETAAEMKARGDLPQNTDSQLTAVMREVTRLNDEGLFDEAAAALEAEMQRIEGDREAIFHQQLNQDRIRNRPEAAAKRIIENLKRSAPTGGVWMATNNLIGMWRKRGRRLGLPFDLHVARLLAELNCTCSKNSKKGASLTELAICQYALAELGADYTYVHDAIKNYQICLRLAHSSTDSINWALTQNNLGNALRLRGEREKDPRALGDAITAYRTALTVLTHEAAPTDWAMLQNNLGFALRVLGDRYENRERLRDAVTAFQAALTVYSPDYSPFDWAMVQNNLGVALGALGARSNDRNHLRQSVLAYEAALTVRSRYAMPMDWASTQNNLGIAQRWLGTLEQNLFALIAANNAFKLCLEVFRQDVTPFRWASTQANLADLALAHFNMTADATMLPTARAHTLAARAVFVQGSDHQTALCDEFLAKIAALEA